MTFDWFSLEVTSLALQRCRVILESHELGLDFSGLSKGKLSSTCARRWEEKQGEVAYFHRKGFTALPAQALPGKEKLTHLSADP